jgi:hypothetical protein
VPGDTAVTSEITEERVEPNVNVSDDLPLRPRADSDFKEDICRSITCVVQNRCNDACYASPKSQGPACQSSMFRQAYSIDTMFPTCHEYLLDFLQ